MPLLAIEGGADPQDPIGNLPRLRQAFPRSHAIVVPHYGHAFDPQGCLAGIVTRFVEHGTVAGLDTACVAKLRPAAFARD